MTYLDKIDVGGQQYKVSNSIPMGTCATPAGSEVKECIFADNFQLSTGNLLSVTFTYANTYGDGSTTYPKLLIQGTQYPIKIPTGTYAGNGAWVNGQAITFMFDGTNFLMTTTPVTDVVAANNMYSVSSNAVYNSIDALTFIKDFPGNPSYTSFIQLPKGVYSITFSIYKNYTDKPSGASGRAIFIAGGVTDSDEQIAILLTSNGGHLYVGNCYGGTPQYNWQQIS